MDNGMTPIEGADWAFSNPDPAQLAAAGLQFGMRYVGPGTAPKHLTPAERDRIWSAGMSICLLVEGAGNDALNGYNLGVTFGQEFVSAAGILGAPTSVPGYVAVDFDCTAAQWPAVRDHLAGFASVTGISRTGVYGSWDVLTWAKRDGVASWFFQAYAPAWSNWRNAAASPLAHVQQYHNNVAMAGGQIDRCRAFATNYGQWKGGAMTPDQEALLLKQVNDIHYAMFTNGGQNRPPGSVTGQLDELVARPVPEGVNAAQVATIADQRIAAAQLTPGPA